jgi:RNA polymerase sigma-70 factor (ECF subfamily)
MTITDQELAQLLRRAQRYDTAAFDRLYELYAERIYRYVWYRVRDPEAAKDLTADVFEKVIQKISTFRLSRQDTVAVFSGWLFQIAHNAVYHFHERREREEAVHVSNAEASEQHTGPSELAKLAEDYERKATLRAAITQLPEDQQEVLILRFWEQLSHAEVANLMGRSEGAIRVLQHRALKELRSLLAPDDPSPASGRGAGQNPEASR